jgi:hypothetical protein
MIPGFGDVSVMLDSYMRRVCAVILLGALTFASATAARADEREAKIAAAIDTPAAVKNGELVFHGNYCGVGNRAGAEPIDALDVACMHHDACTPTGKVQSCACNARLAAEAGAVARDPTQTAELQSLATLTATAATAGMALCVPAALTGERTAAAAPTPSPPAVVVAPPEPTPAAEPIAEPPAPVALASPLQLVTPAAAVPSAP